MIGVMEIDSGGFVFFGSWRKIKSIFWAVVSITVLGTLLWLVLIIFGLANYVYSFVHLDCR